MRRVIVVCLVLAAGCAAETAALPGPIAGRWLTQSGNLEVEIAPCGQALCGTVVKVLANRSMARPGDEMPAMDARPALGLRILSDLVADDGSWDGSIYNRENGKTYACVLRAAAPDRLEVRPYVGLPLFGQTQIWQRVGE